MAEARKIQTFGTRIATDDARGGVTNQGVRYVLGFGIAGAVAALALVALLFTQFS